MDFIEHERDEIGHEDANRNADFRAPMRRIEFDGPNGSGRAHVVAATDDEAHDQFSECLADSDLFGEPESYEVTRIFPNDDEIEELKEADEDLMVSHLHRKAGRRRKDAIQRTVAEVTADE